MTNTCGVQRRWWCLCGVHTHTCTARCLVDSHPLGLLCNICIKRADSWHEHAVREELASRAIPFEVYPKVAGARHGSVDIFLPQPNLIIAVDGPSHMEEACKSVSLGAQHLIDRAFDDACMSGGRRLLRLHYRDIELGDAWVYVQHALAFCSLYPTTTPFVMFSKRYRLLGYQPRMPYAPGTRAASL